MIATAKLQTWLADPAAQAVTRQANVRVASAWRTSPMATRLQQALDESAATVAAVRNCAIESFDDAGWVADLLGMLRRELSNDPFVQPPFRPMPNAIGDGLLLLSHPLASLSLIVIDAARLAEKKRKGAVGRSIRFSGRMMMAKVIGGSAVIQRFAIDPPGGEWCAAAAAPCRIGRVEQLAAGDTIEIDGRREAYTILTAPGNFVFLQCEIACEAAAVSVEYDAVTGRLLGASSTDALASRMMMMLSCLGSLGVTDADAAFLRGLDSPYFEVRWHSLREYMKLCPSKARRHLARLASEDPHPDIRAAAARAVAAHSAREAQPCRA